MDNIIDKSFKCCCRICVTSTDDLVPIFDDGSELFLEEKIKEVFQIMISPEDDLPKCICTRCNFQILSCFDLKNTATKSEEQLSPLRGLRPIDVDGFDYFCRICLSSTKEMVHIFEGDSKNFFFGEKIKEVLQIMVTPEDDLPKCICIRCSFQILSWYDLKETAMKSEEHLRILRGFIPGEPVDSDDENTHSENEQLSDIEIKSVNEDGSVTLQEELPSLLLRSCYLQNFKESAQDNQSLKSKLEPIQRQPLSITRRRLTVRSPVRYSTESSQKRFNTNVDSKTSESTSSSMKNKTSENEYLEQNLLRDKTRTKQTKITNFKQFQKNASPVQLESLKNKSGDNTKTVVPITENVKMQPENAHNLKRLTCRIVRLPESFTIKSEVPNTPMKPNRGSPKKSHIDLSATEKSNQYHNFPKVKPTNTNAIGGNPLFPSLKGYTCIHCPETFHRATELRKHLGIHENLLKTSIEKVVKPKSKNSSIYTYPRTCEECNRKYSCRQSFDKHRRLKVCDRPIGVKKVRSVRNTFPYSRLCESCHAIYHSRQSYWKHLKSNACNSTRRLPCLHPNCSIVVYHKRQMTEHLRIHHGLSLP